jgi:sugar O-acyltransferase (sialic acid O-acetyltransferase NeuD family)
MYDIIIVGAGGFGREVYHWAKDSFSKYQYKIKGFLDDDLRVLDNYSMDIRVISNIDSYVIEEQDRFLIAIGNVDMKKNIITKLKVKNAQFLTLIHPTAIVVNTAKIGEGIIICPFVTISDNVQLGNFAMLNIYSSCGHDAKVGNYCILSPYATLNGFVILEDEVFLGTHTTVIPYKKVGYKSKISANSVVMRDVPAHKMVFGVPGKSI